MRTLRGGRQGSHFNVCVLHQNTSPLDGPERVRMIDQIELGWSTKKKRRPFRRASQTSRGEQQCKLTLIGEQISINTFVRSAAPGPLGARKSTKRSKKCAKHALAFFRNFVPDECTRMQVGAHSQRAHTHTQTMFAREMPKCSNICAWCWFFPRRAGRCSSALFCSRQDGPPRLSSGRPIARHMPSTHSFARLLSQAYEGFPCTNRFRGRPSTRPPIAERSLGSRRKDFYLEGNKKQHAACCVCVCVCHWVRSDCRLDRINREFWLVVGRLLNSSDGLAMKQNAECVRQIVSRQSNLEQIRLGHFKR